MSPLFQTAFHLAHSSFPKGGTCLEFGVFKGGTFCYQAEQIKLKYCDSKLIGFDSWMGLPKETRGIWRPDKHKEGRFMIGKEVVLERLKGLGLEGDERFSLVDGFYCDSLTPLLARSFSNLIFVNIDVDLHSSTLEVLDFIKPLLQVGTVLYWDDWKEGQPSRKESWGEHLAWAEWSQIHPKVRVETVEVNSSNQRIMVILEVEGERNEQSLCK